MDAEVLEVAVTIVEENNAFTPAQINEEPRPHLPDSPHVCVSNFFLLFRGALHRMKKLAIVPAERNSDRMEDVC